MSHLRAAVTPLESTTVPRAALQRTEEQRDLYQQLYFADRALMAQYVAEVYVLRRQVEALTKLLLSGGAR